MWLRSSTLTLGKLAIIFKLDVNQAIYKSVVKMKEGTKNFTGFFNVKDLRRKRRANVARVPAYLPNYVCRLFAGNPPVLPESSSTENKS